MAEELSAEYPGKLEYLDPTLCRVFGGNGRADTRFDVKQNKALIEDIRENGQIMSAMVRRVGDDQYEVVAGSRRLGAIREIRKTDGERMLKAIVCNLSDEAAWKVAEKENANRRDLTPIQCARTWAYAVDAFHEGSQKAFATKEALSESRVSRTLRLLEIPPEILALLKNPEAVSVHFATEFFKFKDNPEKVEAARRYARNLANDVKLYSPAALLDVLCLEPKEREARRTRYLSFSGVEKYVSVQSRRGGGTVLTIKDIAIERDNLSARKALVKDLMKELSQRLLPKANGSAITSKPDPNRDAS